jgi:hypothetical protein
MEEGPAHDFFLSMVDLVIIGAFMVAFRAKIMVDTLGIANAGIRNGIFDGGGICK